MARTPVDDLANAVKDAAYVSVGLGVIAFQRLQVRRNELAKALSGPTEEAKGTLEVARRRSSVSGSSSPRSASARPSTAEARHPIIRPTLGASLGCPPCDRPLRVAIDATSLLRRRAPASACSPRRSCAASATRPRSIVVAYAVTWRGAGRLADLAPAGVARPAPAHGRPAAAPAWSAAEPSPPSSGGPGPIDVVHGPNFVVPPDARRPRWSPSTTSPASTSPSSARATSSQYPDLVGRATPAGRHGPRRLAVRARRGPRAFGARPPTGWSWCPTASRRAARRASGRRGARPCAGGATATCSPSAPSSPARTSPASCAPSTQLAGDRRRPPAGRRRRRTGGASRPYGRRSATAHHRDRIVRLGWVYEQTAALDLLARRSRPRRSRRSTRASACPPVEAMAPARPSWRPRRAPSRGGRRRRRPGAARSTCRRHAPRADATDPHSPTTRRRAQLAEDGRPRRPELYTWAAAPRWIAGLVALVALGAWAGVGSSVAHRDPRRCAR